LVGLKVPETGVPVEPIKAGAASSKVQLIPTASVPPITSETRINFCPAGLTRSMSTSDGKVWLNPRMVTVTLVIAPGTPETVMLLGYGLATPASLIVIAVGFANVMLEPHGVGVGVGVGGPSEGVGVAVAVGEGVGDRVAVGDGDGGTVGDGIAQTPPAMRETSSMTKLLVPLLGPIYSKSRACDAPLAKAFRLTTRSA
jgi:hypothetical protein